MTTPKVMYVVCSFPNHDPEVYPVLITNEDDKHWISQSGEKIPKDLSKQDKPYKYFEETPELKAMANNTLLSDRFNVEIRKIIDKNDFKMMAKIMEVVCPKS